MSQALNKQKGQEAQVCKVCPFLALKQLSHKFNPRHLFQYLIAQNYGTWPCWVQGSLGDPSASGCLAVKMDRDLEERKKVCWGPPTSCVCPSHFLRSSHSVALLDVQAG